MLEGLPHLNAALNTTAAALLIAGWLFIRHGRQKAHMRAMLSAFGVSVLFLVSYLIYHIGIGGTKRFPVDVNIFVRWCYLTILLSHSLLAAVVPFLAVVSIYLGLRDYRKAHRRLARWTLPIWLYVSVTGVVVYWMLYHAYAP